ncbi:MAG: DUF4350 domain-containing protein [Methanolobus sp.]
MDNEGSAGFSEMVEDIEDSGYIVRDNFMDNSNLGFISEEELQTTDIFVIINPRRDFSSDEIELIYNFVNDGGNLIVICDSLGSVNTTNQLLGQFALAFSNEVILNPEVSFNASKKTFNYAVPLATTNSNTYHTVDSEELWRINCSQKLSEDTELPYENRTLMLIKKPSEGTVTILGTKEFLKNDRYQQDKGIWHYILAILTRDSTPSCIILNPFEIQLPANNPEFFNTTFIIHYEISSLNELTGEEELVRKVDLSFAINPSLTFAGSSGIENISEESYEEI